MKLIKIKEKSKKRVGRGIGTGKGGHTSGRGQKGQSSRSGFHFRPNFAGGQNTIGKGLPVRRGYGNFALKKKFAVRLSDLNKLDETEITLELLRKVYKLSKRIQIKIVGGGKLDKKVKVIDVPVTASVKQALEKA